MTDGMRRREVLAVAGAGLALAPLPWRAALADDDAARRAIAEVLGDADAVREGRVAFNAPAVADNGAMVPVKVVVDSPMTEADHVTAIHVFAPQNPRAFIAAFHLSPLMGRAEVQTRIRLGRTQRVLAVATLSDGTRWSGAAEVRVTLGGCKS